MHVDDAFGIKMDLLKKTMNIKRASIRVYKEEKWGEESWSQSD